MSETALQDDDFQEETNPNEVGYPRFLQMLTAKVPKVLSLGFLTVNSPSSPPAPSEQSIVRNKELLVHLGQCGHAPIRIEGRFWETLEWSVIVPNISRGSCIAHGSHFEKAPVIWGNKVAPDKFRFEFIENEITIDTRDVVLSGVAKTQRIKKKIEARNAGSKFLIPFLDESGKYKIIESESSATYITDVSFLQGSARFNDAIDTFLDPTKTAKGRYYSRVCLRARIEEIARQLRK